MNEAVALARGLSDNNLADCLEKLIEFMAELDDDIRRDGGPEVMDVPRVLVEEAARRLRRGGVAGASAGPEWRPADRAG